MTGPGNSTVGRAGRLRSALLSLWLLAASACAPPEPVVRPPHALIPVPDSIVLDGSSGFVFDSSTTIVVDIGDTEALRIGEMLASWIGNTVESRPPVLMAEGNAAGGAAARADAGTDVGRDAGTDVGTVRLTRAGAEASLGPEGYTLTASADGVTIRAPEAAGLFYGVQTLRQLLPAVVEYTAAYPLPPTVPGVSIVDRPRFEWRGLMLDVSRHFLPPDDVRRFIDLMALYKLNRLHLHLSDDQGWRVEIPGRPALTSHGGSTEVGGGPGGFYTVDEYEGLVRYAAARFVTVVPEIDMPGHTNAALASIPELNCDGVVPALYTGTAVGFSSVCTEREATYAFVEDVVRELSRMTSGPYFHMGGDEVRTLSDEQYEGFVSRVQDIVRAHGKQMVGWDEIAMADVGAGTVIQLWRPLWRSEAEQPLDSAAAAAANALRDGVARAIRAGARVLLSPADRVYLDLKYDSSTALGLTWAGIPDTRTAYDWSVSDLFSEIPEGTVIGIEAPLWSETLGTVHDFEFMAFPRLPGVAEIGWSRDEHRLWEEYRLRLAEHAERWTVLGVNFRRSPLVPWPD